jgi:hypothetical protein
MSEHMMLDQPGFRLFGETAALFAALAKAQAAFGPIERTKEVTVRPKDNTKSSYKFLYAPYENLIEATRGPLAANGLTVSQPYHSVQDGWMLRTILAHSSGAFMEATDFIPYSKAPANQDLGGYLSYRKRYGYAGILCLASEDDDDSNRADGHEVTHSEERRHKPPTSTNSGKQPAKDNLPKEAIPPKPIKDMTRDERLQWLDKITTLDGFYVALQLCTKDETLRSLLVELDVTLQWFAFKYKEFVAKGAWQRGSNFEKLLADEKQKLAYEKDSMQMLEKSDAPAESTTTTENTES